MTFTYNQLCGALGMLKTSGADLPWAEIDADLRRIARESGPDCDTDEIKAMHRQYRDKCLRLGLIKAGEFFVADDCVPLV